MNASSRGHDNPSGTPDRSLEVGQNELERAVREVFIRQVAASRAPVGDPATAAIRRAHRIQRRRTLAGTSLAAMAVILAAATAMQLGAARPPVRETVVIGDPDSGPVVILTPTAPPTAADTRTPLADVDLVLGRAIVTAQGRRIGLVDAGRIERAHRLADGGGWLAVGPAGLPGRLLWRVAPNGTAEVLLAGAEEIVLDATGQQVAWKQGTALTVAKVVNQELITTARAEVPAEAVPLRFVGGDVLVRLAPDRPGHVLWRLQPGRLDPGTDRISSRIFGALPDGRLVGEVTKGTPRRTCLTLLDPVAELAPVGADCGPELSGGGSGAVSPDGRWLLANRRSEGQVKAVLVDLRRLGSSVEPVPAGPAMSGAVVWSAAGIAYYVDSAGQLIRVEVERANGRLPETRVMGGLPAGVHPVVVSSG